MKAVRALLTGLCLLASLSASAETPLPPERPRDPPPETTPDPLPPYQAKLDRLAELLGTLSFMRDLCGVGDGSVWRSQMTALMQAEGTLPERRDRLAGAFNRGFRGYATMYRSCTPAADLVIERSLAEGSALSRELSAVSAVETMLRRRRFRFVPLAAMGFTSLRAALSQNAARRLSDSQIVAAMVGRAVYRAAQFRGGDAEPGTRAWSVSSNAARYKPTY